MEKLYLVPRRTNQVQLFELLNYLATKKAVTAIDLEKKFGIGIITSKEIIEGLIGLGVLKRGTFFHPVNLKILEWNRRIAIEDSKATPRDLNAQLLLKGR